MTGDADGKCACGCGKVVEPDSYGRDYGFAERCWTALPLWTRRELRRHQYSRSRAYHAHRSAAITELQRRRTYAPRRRPTQGSTDPWHEQADKTSSQDGAES